MELKNSIEKLVEMFRVANDDVIGNTARQILNLKWKEGLSARNQAHKILDELALTNKIKKGKGYYAVNNYQGEYKEHDRLITSHISRLILLGYPITILREVAFPVGLRSDLLVLIGKNGKGICAVIEVANNETPDYLEKKAVTWRHWNEATDELSRLFGIDIPSFTLVVSGKSHPEMLDFESFIKELS